MCSIIYPLNPPLLQWRGGSNCIREASPLFDSPYPISSFLLFPFFFLLFCHLGLSHIFSSMSLFNICASCSVRWRHVPRRWSHFAICLSSGIAIKSSIGQCIRFSENLMSALYLGFAASLGSIQKSGSSPLKIGSEVMVALA